MTFGLKNRHSMACIVQTKRLRYKLNKWKDGGRQALPQAVKKSQLTSSQTVEISFPFPSLCGRRKKGRGSGGGKKSTLSPSHVPLRVYALTHRWLFELSPIQSPVCFKIVFVCIFPSFCITAVLKGVSVSLRKVWLWCVILLSRRACFWPDLNEFSTLFVLTSEESGIKA